MTSRAEYLAWCKQRALQYVDRGDCISALTSMASDLDKHPETANHKGSELGLLLLMAGNLRDPADMRRFIEGFN